MRIHVESSAVRWLNRFCLFSVCRWFPSMTFLRVWLPADLSLWTSRVKVPIGCTWEKQTMNIWEITGSQLDEQAWTFFFWDPVMVLLANCIRSNKDIKRSQWSVALVRFFPRVRPCLALGLFAQTHHVRILGVLGDVGNANFVEQ